MVKFRQNEWSIMKGIPYDRHSNPKKGGMITRHSYQNDDHNGPTNG